MSEYYKYQRTYHLPWSLGSTSDDKFMADTSAFEGKYVVVTMKMDGENCVGPETIIKTEEGNKTIKEICELEYRGGVLSCNIENNQIEYEKIVAHNIGDENDDWFEIELENGVKIEITANHYVFLPELGCYRKVSDLSENDIILFLP